MRGCYGPPPRTHKRRAGYPYRFTSSISPATAVDARLKRNAYRLAEQGAIERKVFKEQDAFRALRVTRVVLLSPALGDRGDDGLLGLLPPFDNLLAARLRERL